MRGRMLHKDIYSHCKTHFHLLMQHSHSHKGQVTNYQISELNYKNYMYHLVFCTRFVMMTNSLLTAMTEFRAVDKY